MLFLVVSRVLFSFQCLASILRLFRMMLRLYFDALLRRDLRFRDIIEFLKGNTGYFEVLLSVPRDDKLA